MTFAPGDEKLNRLDLGIIVHSQFFDRQNGGTPTGQMRRIEVEPGEVVGLSTTLRVAKTSWEMVGQPPGGNAAIRDGRVLALHVPGIYTIRSTVDGLWTRDLDLVVVPHAHMYRGQERVPEQRLALRGWLNHGRTAEEIIERYER